MLTEADAWRLFTRHCCALQHQDSVQWVGVDILPLNTNWAAGSEAHVDMVVVPIDATGECEPRVTGARMRLALGVAHAVSCCRGFDPATRKAFWRRVVANLWSGANHKAVPDQRPFSNATFAHFALEWHGDYRRDDAFWIGFLHGNRECDASLFSVMEQLQPHMSPASHPPLCVSLWSCISSKWRSVKNAGLPQTHTIEHEWAVPQPVLQIILRAALESHTRTWPFRTILGIVLECRVDDDTDATRETLDLLGRTQTLPHLQITIDRLVFQLTPPKPPREAEPGAHHHLVMMTRGRELGKLLRTLLVDDSGNVPHIYTVVLYGCSHTDYRLVGAALSAVAWASPPITALRCSGLSHTSRLGHQLFRLAWLAYALHTRRRRSIYSGTPTPLLDLALLSRGVVINDQESEYLRRLVATGTPLRDVVGDALRLRYGGDNARVARLQVDCLRIGSTVKLYRGTQLYYQPDRVADEFVVATLWCADDNDEVELDVVAHLVDLGFVGVVYAGYGLLWAEETRVATWQRLDDDDQRMTDDDDNDDDYKDVRLSSLAFTFDCADNDLPPTLVTTAHRVAAMLPLLPCETLHTLKIDRGVIMRHDLEQLLDSFPCLQALVLDRCVIETLIPLIESYQIAQRQNRRARVAVLSLLGARDLRMRDTMVGSAACHTHTLGLDWSRRNGEAAEWVIPLVDALAHGVARDVLRELFIDLAFMPSLANEQAVLQQLAHAVASSSLPLTRLHVTCQSRMQVACASLFSPLRDVVLADPPRVRCAVLSVLRRFRCALPGVASMVLMLVEGNVVRTVTWDHWSEP